ncbi:MAG: DMT family transporter [Burkholderiales bacterium]|nr:DMT family transporter [Burkholderiales bacterium]
MNRLTTWQLFAVAVLIWGTTWHAIVYQLAAMAPAWGVATRFALAAAAVLALSAWRGDRLRFGAAVHARLALQGANMYGLSYICVYHAELHVPSGLVAVGYSASPLLAGVGAWLLWRTPLSRRFLAGGALGVAGVALIFAPELAQVGARPSAALGLAYTVAAVTLSAVGALAASRNAVHRLPFWPALGWGLAWGAATSTALAALTLPWPALPTAPAWWLSLAYLALAGTVLAFAAFLTLQQRIGPGPAASIGVMTPVLALVVSAAFEGFRPGLWTLAGSLLALAGNALMLRRGRG